jgi:cobalamin synthase
VAATTAASTSNDRQNWLYAGLALLVICAVSYVFTWLSLDSVSGVTRRRDGSCCKTEFVNGDWWMWLFALALPVGAVARWVPWAGIVAVAVPTYASFYIANTTANRYVESAWGDGLESLGYVGSFVHGLIFAYAAVIGTRLWRRRRSRAARPS